MRVASLLMVVASLNVVSAAQAFEVEGFRSGMPIEDALKLARQKGYTYKEPSRGRDNSVYGSTNGGPGLGYANDKLCILGRFSPGDMHRFVELLNQRISVFGPATYEVHEEIMGNGNKFSQLAAKWRMGSDHTHVIIGKIGRAQENISGNCPGSVRFFPQTTPRNFLDNGI
jgi:hypothetical protein